MSLSTQPLSPLREIEFQQEQVKYLGLVIREGKVTMDPVKVQAVVNWPTPRTLCDLHGFLGFANFYHCFIKDFTKLA